MNPARRLVLAATAAATCLLALSACSASPGHQQAIDSGASSSATADPPSAPASTASPAGGSDAALPGMPPLLDPNNIYAADAADRLSPTVRSFPNRIYVPNTESNTVTVIDPATYKVLYTLKVGREPQHVVPSWDLKTLWVNNDLGNSLTPIDPATGKAGRPVSVHDPYNLYFTPDGRYAIVMASNDRQIVFRDAHTMRVVKAVPSECGGVNHADFSPNGRYFIVSCEFSGDLLKVDTERMRVVGKQRLPEAHAMPQDVKLSPDGRTFYIADMTANGVWRLNGDTFAKPTLLYTGRGAHGLYVSRDAKSLYISNRGEGSISVLDFATGRLTAKWHLPGGGSPDMGGVSSDGKVLWLSGRYNSVVYAIDTTNGKLIKKIPVGAGPHGLCVYPQPGRYSLGHTGVFR